MDFLIKLGKIDRRVVYLLLILATLVPLISPVGLPFGITTETRAFYAAIEAVEPGQTILMAIDYSVSGGPDVHPQTQAVFRHAMRRGLKVVFAAFVAEGTEFANQIIAEGERMAGKQYGVDFINLGYLPGSEVAISAFAQDVLVAFPKDVRGGNTSEYAIMAGLTTVADFVLVTEFATGIPGPSGVDQAGGHPLRGSSRDRRGDRHGSPDDPLLPGWPARRAALRSQERGRI